MEINSWSSNIHLNTERLELRSIQQSDSAFLIQLWTNEKVREHLGGPLTEQKANQRVTEYIDKKCYFIVIEQTSKNLIGLVSLDTYRTGEIEVSYQFLPKFWGKGFGREAITEVLNWGFKNIAVDHIVAVTQASNIQSRRVLEKLGMTIRSTFEEFNETQFKYSITIADVK